MNVHRSGSKGVGAEAPPTTTRHA
ncbi:DUF6053 domain-containing protein [Lysobacter enzymogenes]